MNIIVDAMGGDNAPGAIVDGALLARREYGIEITLVGRQDLINAELERIGAAQDDGITVVDAADVVEMDDSPSQVLRGKRNSSIHTGLRLVKDGKGSAFYSAGNTGAVMAVSMLILRTLEGIDRPAIGAVIPTIDRPTMLIDVGANVDCKPHNYMHFAIMGSSYAKAILGYDTPRVGLLSIGEEDVKGNEATKTAFALLKRNEHINFIGNVEGKELFKSRADVIVTDGFSGNVALKVMEHTAWFLTKMIKEELTAGFFSKIGALIARPAFKRIKQRADSSEYGGAPLLGVGGVCIIGHGSSESVAVKNGIRVAKELAEQDVNGMIEAEIADSIKLLNVDNDDSFWNNMRDKIRKKTTDSTED